MKPWQKAFYAVAVLVVIGGIAGAVSNAIRVNGVQHFVQASSPSVATATKPVVWSDNATVPNMRYSDGTSANYVAACVPTTTGDVCSWNATTGNWQRGTAGSASTGNWTFSTNNADLTGAAAMGIATTGAVANAIAIGHSGITTTVTGGLTQQTGAFSLTGNAASTLATSAGNITINPAAGLFAEANGSVYFDLNINNPLYMSMHTSLVPNADNSQSVGNGGAGFAFFYGYRYLGVQQDISAAASLTINSANGEYVRILLSSTAITSITVPAPGSVDQTFHVIVIQDATGGRTIPTTWTNVAFPGGTYTATSGANKIDKIDLSYFQTTGKWIATVALNCS